MITKHQLQCIALPLILSVGACIAQANAIPTVRLRQYAIASGQNTWQEFSTVDSRNGHAAVRARISGSDDFDTLIWYWNGSSGSIKYREGQTTIQGHGLGVTVRSGQIEPSVGINAAGTIAWSARMRITGCPDPDNPVCAYHEKLAVLRDNQYAMGAIDPSLICNLSDYVSAVDSRVNAIGQVYTRFRPGGLNPTDNIARSSPGEPTVPLICHGDPVGNTDGNWGRLKSLETMRIVPSTGQWYAINQLSGIPFAERFNAIISGDRAMGMMDTVYMWTDPTQPPDCDAAYTIDFLDDIAYSAHGHVLWSGRLTLGDDINFSNNDVIGYGPYIIFQEGMPVQGVPGALSAYFGRLTGGGSGRYMATDDNGNIIWVITTVATFPGDDWPGDPDDTFEKEVEVVMYNGQVVLAAGDLIDQNGDGNLTPGTGFTRVSRTISLGGQNEAWFVGMAKTTLGDRTIVFQLRNLPAWPLNPWRNPFPYDFCEPEVVCIGDITGDGKTGHQDLAALLAAWNTMPGDPNWNPDADLDGNGHVHHTDLALLLSDWGCPWE